MEEASAKETWDAMMEDIARDLENTFITSSLVPIHDANLRNSIRVVPDGEQVLISMLNYGEWVEFGCFLGNSHRVRILTKRGYKALKDVKIGDLVLTHKNRWKKVLSKPIYNINKKIPRYTIKLKSGKKVTVTEEHPFLTKRGWIKAKELKESDILMEID